MSSVQVHEPSLLPGWSKSHVVAHVALNAEGFIEVSRALNAGRRAVMYPGGVEARDDAIAELAGASIDELLSRLRSANSMFIESWNPQPPPGDCATAGGHPVFASASVLQRRLRELQVHLVDLGLDEFGVEHWTDAFVNSDLELQWPTVRFRTPKAVDVRDEFGTRWTSSSESAGAAPVQVERRRLLGWVLDRCRVDELPPLDAWSNRSKWEHLPSTTSSSATSTKSPERVSTRHRATRSTSSTDPNPSRTI